MDVSEFVEVEIEGRSVCVAAPLPIPRHSWKFLAFRILHVVVFFVGVLLITTAWEAPSRDWFVLFLALAKGLVLSGLAKFVQRLVDTRFPEYPVVIPSRPYSAAKLAKASVLISGPKVAEDVGWMESRYGALTFVGSVFHFAIGWEDVESIDADELAVSVQLKTVGPIRRQSVILEPTDIGEIDRRANSSDFHAAAQLLPMLRGAVANPILPPVLPRVTEAGRAPIWKYLLQGAVLGTLLYLPVLTIRPELAMANVSSALVGTVMGIFLSLVVYGQLAIENATIRARLRRLQKIQKPSIIHSLT